MAEFNKVLGTRLTEQYDSIMGQVEERVPKKSDLMSEVAAEIENKLGFTAGKADLEELRAKVRRAGRVMPAPAFHACLCMSCTALGAPASPAAVRCSTYDKPGGRHTMLELHGMAWHGMR